MFHLRVANSLVVRALPEVVETFVQFLLQIRQSRNFNCFPHPTGVLPAIPILCHVGCVCLRCVLNIPSKSGPAGDLNKRTL